MKAQEAQELTALAKQKRLAKDDDIIEETLQYIYGKVQEAGENEKEELVLEFTPNVVLRPNSNAKDYINNCRMVTTDGGGIESKPTQLALDLVKRLQADNFDVTEWQYGRLCFNWKQNNFDHPYGRGYDR